MRVNKLRFAMVLCPICGNFTDNETCEVCGIKLSVDHSSEYKGGNHSHNSEKPDDH